MSTQEETLKEEINEQICIDAGIKSNSNGGILERIDGRQKVLAEVSQYLMQLESQLSIIFAASPDVIMVIDREGKVEKISPMVERIIGVNSKDLVGQKLEDLLHPEDLVGLHEIKQKIKKEKSAVFFNRENYFVNRWRKSGGDFARLAWRVALYNPDEEKFLAYATDVSSALIENVNASDLLSRVVSLSLDGIIITDALSDDDPIIYANPAFEKATGYSLEELIGQNPRMLTHRDKSIKQEAKKTLKNAMMDGKGCDVLLLNQRKNGEVFYNHLNVTPVFEGETLTNWIGIARDVTKEVKNGMVEWSCEAKRGFAHKN
jgi:PAS domain S-box-containing protein